MPLLIRYVVIGFLSITALSLLTFQSIEIFQAFIDMFFEDFKNH